MAPADPIGATRAGRYVKVPVLAGSTRDESKLFPGLLAMRPARCLHYRFDWDELPSPFDKAYGVAHSFDLPSIFGNFGPSLYSTIPFSRVNRACRLDLSAQMMQSIGSFARDGDPNSASLGSVWPAWPRSLVFDSNLEAARLAVE